MRMALFFAVLITASATAATGQILLERHNRKLLEEMGENREDFETLFTKIRRETPYWVLVTSGYRSDAEQERLYALNKKNAKPGSSPHQHRRAMDINLVSIGGFVRKSDSKETWEATGAPGIARGLGFRWGGDFRNYHDPVHFEVRRSR
jgi:hypothetical protein